MEDFSRKIYAPLASGSVIQQLWFFERARGQYEQPLMQMTKKQRDDYKLVRPKDKKFTLTDLSKYMNAADMRTKGYELSLSWRDQFDLGGHPFGYSVRGSLSDFRSYITKFDNPTKTFAKDYYEGMRIGDIWGFQVDGLFATDE